MTNLLLLLVLVMLALVYKKLSQFVEGKNSESSPELGIKDMVRGINEWLHLIDKNTSAVADYFLADNPAGTKSNKYKKLENLIKIYAQHLMTTKKLSEKDSLIRARFEVRIFGEEKVIDEVDDDVSDGVYWRDRDKAEKDYYASDILEKDIKNFWDIEVKGVKKVTPYELMARIYDVIVKQHYEEGENIEMAWFRDEDGYYDFIKNRACIYHLEKLGVIKKANKEGWGGKPKWTITTTNLDELKRIIYEGETSHDNDFFEERFNEGKLPRIFQKSYD